MDKDEALKLALEALNTPRPTDSYPPLWRSYEKTINDAITALKQALEQPVQEPVGTYGEIHESMQALLRSGLQRDQYIYMAMKDKPLYTTPPAQPVIPDAMTSADIQEHIEYVAGWNDCRQAMLEMMK